MIDLHKERDLLYRIVLKQESLLSEIEEAWHKEQAAHEETRKSADEIAEREFDLDVALKAKEEELAEAKREIEALKEKLPEEKRFCSQCMHNGIGCDTRGNCTGVGCTCPEWESTKEKGKGKWLPEDQRVCGNCEDDENGNCPQECIRSVGHPRWRPKNTLTQTSPL